LKSIVNRVDPFLKDNSLRDMLELLAGKPAPVRQRPMAPAAVNPTVSQQEGKQLLALAAKVIRCGLASPHEIPHRFMRRVRRPDSRQFARPSAGEDVEAESASLRFDHPVYPRRA
jgi:hypothetical protein